MLYREFGKTGWQVSAIGMGAWNIGNQWGTIDEATALASFVQTAANTTNRIPFRRFILGEGYEVWIGRNARQNDALTFRHARKYDLWMHARGVAGSHAVLRLPSRDAQPNICER